MENKRSILAAAAAVLLALAIGVAAEDNAPLAPNAASDRFVNTTTATFLSPTGGVQTTVLTMNLRAGDWIVTSDNSAVGLNQPTDVVRCDLRAGGALVSHGTQIGNADGYPLVAQLTATLGLHLAGPGLTLVESVCSHDNTTGGTYYIDPGATLWAHNASDLRP
jgi:hypothetical protein